MTEKELRKLRRRGLLDLLMQQSEEVARRQREIEALEEENNSAHLEAERLRERFDAAEQRVKDLVAQLDEVDEELAQLENATDEIRTGSVSDVSRAISEIFENAQAQADAYLESIRERSERPEDLPDRLLSDGAPEDAVFFAAPGAAVAAVKDEEAAVEAGEGAEEAPAADAEAPEDEALPPEAAEESPEAEGFRIPEIAVPKPNLAAVEVQKAPRSTRYTLIPPPPVLLALSPVLAPAAEEKAEEPDEEPAEPAETPQSALQADSPPFRGAKDGAAEPAEEAAPEVEATLASPERGGTVRWTVPGPRSGGGVSDEEIPAVDAAETAEEPAELAETPQSALQAGARPASSATGSAGLATPFRGAEDGAEEAAAPEEAAPEAAAPAEDALSAEPVTPAWKPYRVARRTLPASEAVSAIPKAPDLSEIKLP